MIYRPIPFVVCAVGVIGMFALSAPVEENLVNMPSPAQSQVQSLDQIATPASFSTSLTSPYSLLENDTPEKVEEETSTTLYDVPLSAELQEVLIASCEESGVPVHVALGLIWVESRFDPDAVSSAGCYGLCQLSPKYFPSDLHYAENIQVGVGHLGSLFDRYGDLEAALTAYHDGHDSGQRWYAQAVLEAAERWR